jgi:FtsP/CotA-like multicopper oxidase with cupredoxin domain
MVRVLVVMAALIAASGVGAGFPAMAQPARAQAQRTVEGRIVSLQGNQVLLHDGTTMTIPREVAQPIEMDQGDTVRLTYEVRNGQNVATSIQFMDRPGGLRPR